MIIVAIAVLTSACGGAPTTPTTPPFTGHWVGTDVVRQLRPRTRAPSRERSSVCPNLFSETTLRLNRWTAWESRFGPGSMRVGEFWTETYEAELLSLLPEL